MCRVHLTRPRLVRLRRNILPWWILPADEGRHFSPCSVQGSGAAYVSEFFLGPEEGKRRERGSDVATEGL